MSAEGDRVPDVELWTAPGERRSLAELHSDGAALFLFYLFDWSST
jgi:peroxiredoxin